MEPMDISHPIHDQTTGAPQMTRKTNNTTNPSTATSLSALSSTELKAAYDRMEKVLTYHN